MMNEIMLPHHIQLKPTPEMIPRLEYTKGTQIQHPIVEDGVLRYMGLEIETHGGVPNQERVLYARTSNDGGVWRLTYELKPVINPLPPTGNAVGIDLGLKWLVITSKGKKVAPHPDIVMLDKKIRRLMDERDSKHTDSNRYREISRRIERHRQALNDIQLHQANEIANNLVLNNDLIVVEDVEPDTPQMKHHPDYIIANQRANWPLLKQVIEFRCIEAGRTFVLASRYWTSQECPECSLWVPKPLSRRWHQCPHCGYEADRDVAAAQTILKRGYEQLEGISKRAQTDIWYPKLHPKYVGE